MSSKNKPSIQSLVSAITNGLTPGQFQDLAQKISDDLDKVFIQINTGPLPRVLARTEIDDNVAYTDIFDIFGKGIGISGGIAVAGSITFDAAKGLLVQSKVGTANDFELDGPTGTLILSIPTGTITPTFEGLTTFKLGLKVSGGVIADAIISKDAVHGLSQRAVAGSTNDWALFAAGSATPLLAIPTGTGDFTITGSITQITNGKHFEFLERADPVAGPINTGRLYVRDNGAGKTQLCIIFNTGAVQVIATQP